MTNLTRTISLLFMVLIVSAFNDGCGKETISSPTTTIKPSLILVFCDVSNSVDSSSIKNVISKAKMIISALSDGSKIVIYPIDDNDYPEKILELSSPKNKEDDNFTGILKEQVDKDKKTQLEKLLNEKAVELETKINSRYEEILNDKSSKHRSCIFNTFSKINEFFKNEDSEKYNFEVIYLSDMIEQCNSNVGSVFICGGKKGDLPTKKEEVLKNIDTNLLPTINLKKLIGKNISIVITTKMMGSSDYKCLSPQNHLEIWEKAFGKAGYTKEEFELIPFGDDLPNRFKEKN